MICYRCGGNLDLARDTCPKCGADVHLFKKIVYTSNRYYNNGLEKARARDLTGAKEALKSSLKLYRKNTGARNLLGLVYYASGESAEAVKMWILSKKLQPEKNPADRYLNYIRRNMNSLDSENHGIRKYNQALNYCRTGAKDLAMIQLKKVVSVHSNMIKAYELLALLYLDDGKPEQARKVLNDCLKVDHGNVSALYYLKEIESLTSDGGLKSAGTVGDEEREQLIIPVRFRDFGSYLANALYILIGVLLGIAIAWYVIVPGKVEKSLEAASLEADGYESQISDLQKSVAEADAKESESIRVSEEEEQLSIEASVEALKESSEEAKEAAQEYQTMPVIEKYTNWVKNNEAIQQDASLNSPETRESFIRIFMHIDNTMVADKMASTYRTCAGCVLNPGNMLIYIEEAEAMASEDVESAADYYEVLTWIMPEREDLRYRTAQLYEEAGDADKAANFYWQEYWLFPTSQYAADSETKFKEITGRSEIDPLPEGTDTAACIAPVSLEELLKDVPEGEETTAAETPETETDISESESSETAAPDNASAEN